MWTWIDRQWVEYPTHTVRREYDFPVVGRQPVYLNGHDELHSLSKHIDANSIRFWMGFGDHYINVFTVLRTLGLLSHLPVKVGDDEVVPLQVVKAVLPDPQTLAAGYTGKTCIGNIVTGQKDGRRRELFIYQISDHAAAYEEVGSQGDQLHRRRAADRRGAAHRVRRVGRRPDGERRGARPDAVHRPPRPDGPADRDARDRPTRRAHFDGTVGPLARRSTTPSPRSRISAADPMIAVRQPAGSAPH